MCKISTVQRIVSRFEIKLPEILTDIRDGVLPAYRHEDGINLTSLWFDYPLVMTYKNKCLSRYMNRTGLLSINTVCKILKCKSSTLRNLYRAKLLIPIKSGRKSRWFYKQEDIDLFLEKYIDSKQAAKLLNISQLTIQKWVRSGWLSPLTGPEIDESHMYRFDKAKLLDWRDKRVTFGEALSLLNVSKATLHRWVVQNRITPIEDMGGKQRWFWKQDILSLIEQ